MNSKIQNLLILLGIVALVGLGYYLVTQNADSSLKNSAVDNRGAVETAQFLQKLNELTEIKLNGDIFGDPRFTTLVDNSEPVLEVPKGRANPFAPTY